VQQDHDIWRTSNLLTTLVTCWHQFLAISAEWRFHSKLITFEPRIFTSIPILILFLYLHMYLSKRHKTIIYHWKKYSEKTNPKSGQVSEVSVSPFCKIYMFHSMLYVGVKASINYVSQASYLGLRSELVLSKYIYSF